MIERNQTFFKWNLMNECNFETFAMYQKITHEFNQMPAV